jgi:hypothetical protein
MSPWLIPNHRHEKATPLIDFCEKIFYFVFLDLVLKKSNLWRNKDLVVGFWEEIFLPPFLKNVQPNVLTST